MTRAAVPVPKVAVITGAARGIGLAINQWFVAHGYRVAMLDVDGPALDAAVAAINAASHATSGDTPQAFAWHCDVSIESQVQATAVAIIQRLGRVDALVNNAGVAVFKPLLATTFDEWRQVMATNLDGVFLCTQVFAPLMQPTGGGAIVNIASISGLRASTLRVAYGTSKAAVIHLTKQQAVELAHIGIRVNAIAPGPVDTAMALAVHSAAIRADYHATIPLNRYGTPEEIANAVGFLCSPAASYINGQVLAVDGGFDAAGVGLPTLRAAS